uniref:Fe2OG dioxygenase domain-containing protein n=1 Tax=Hyaloperonospora arabidopsidis (strain Emoy2) TaxID=559515 RepID=M4BZP2_HYAAE
MVSTFKASEKRWKRATSADLLSDPALVDPRNLSDEQKAKVQCIGSWTWKDEDEERPVLAFDNFGASHCGFCVIPNALNAKTQLKMARSCLTEFAEEPHVTNMHLLHQNGPDIWHKARVSHPQDPAQSLLLSKLCWAALGYHYDWTARKYDKNSFSLVPEVLQELGRKCAAVCDMTLTAEAVIVNFYKMKSSMGGHLDDVEYTMDHPVVSVSLGSQCVFLMGGQGKDEPPLPVLLRSGDIAIMGGVSRTCYHGVARVLPTPFTIAIEDLDKLCRDEKDRAEHEAIRTYLSTQRININVRQVYPTDRVTD